MIQRKLGIRAAEHELVDNAFFPIVGIVEHGEIRGGIGGGKAVEATSSQPRMFARVSKLILARAGSSSCSKAMTSMSFVRLRRSLL